MQRQWLSADTMVLVEKKHQKFVQWQEQRTSVERPQEYLTLYVRRATRADKEKWWDEKMTELEEGMKHNRQGDFFKKLKRLSGTKGTPADTILDEAGQQLKKPEEKVARWKRHFEHTLNVQRQVAADLTELQDNAGSDIPGVTREDVERAVMRLRNGKAAPEDRI